MGVVVTVPHHSGLDSRELEDFVSRFSQHALSLDLIQHAFGVCDCHSLALGSCSQVAVAVDGVEVFRDGVFIVVAVWVKFLFGAMRVVNILRGNSQSKTGSADICWSSTNCIIVPSILALLEPLATVVTSVCQPTSCANMTFIVMLVFECERFRGTFVVPRGRAELSPCCFDFLSTKLHFCQNLWCLTEQLQNLCHPIKCAR